MAAFRPTTQQRRVLDALRNGDRWTRDTSGRPEDVRHFLWPRGEQIRRTTIDALVRHGLIEATPYSPICGDGGGLVGD